MDRTSIDVPGRKPGSSTRLSGVTLAQLLPATAGRSDDDRTYEIQHGFFHQRVIHESELEPGSDLVIADEVDRKTVDRASLFWLTGKANHGPRIVIGKVTSVAISGEVPLECVVNTKGEVTDVKILRSLDATFGLDQEAIKTARQWRFSPGTRLGEPVPVVNLNRIELSVNRSSSRPALD